MSDFTRRTVVRGAAWTVPVVAVAVNAPAFATSYDPPPPVIDFGGACANTGATQKGCGSDKSLQVPLTLTNQTGTDYVFQITGMFTCNNCGAAPTQGGPGVYSGIDRIYATPDHTVPSQDDCNPYPTSPCSNTGLPGGTVLVTDGTVAAKYWIVSVSTGASSSFQSTITYNLLDPKTCTVIKSGVVKTATAISPANCNGR